VPLAKKNRRKVPLAKKSKRTQSGYVGSEPSAVTALVLHPRFSKRRNGSAASRDTESSLEEAVRLTDAIGLKIAHSESVTVVSPRPATLFGSGRVESTGQLVRELDVEVAVVDGKLSPVQQRNLERAWDCKVIDRTGLILEIFGARARTREGRLQVDLAALEYQRSRLVRSWTHLERQRGGFGFMGGPGETQIEADRRQISERIARLKRELEQLTRTRGLHRSSRQKVPYPVVALVGYTNAGKSTLFNRLTDSNVLAKDMLFATLDPTMRGVSLPSGQRIILSDTVGFISDLPTTLIAAFRATLEEVLEADLIVHVRDSSHPDTNQQKLDVLAVMEELGVSADAEERMLEAHNKIDLLDDTTRAILSAKSHKDVHLASVSAHTGDGIGELLQKFEELLSGNRQILELQISLSDGATLAWLYRHGNVLSREDVDGMARVKVGLDAPNVARFQRRQESADILLQN